MNQQKKHGRKERGGAQPWGGKKKGKRKEGAAQKRGGSGGKGEEALMEKQMPQPKPLCRSGEKKTGDGSDVT